MAVSLRVLMVEDRQADAEFLVYTLRHAGFDLDYTLVDNRADYLQELRENYEVMIVKDCAELHGGGVSFKSENGMGTAFTVRLPTLVL